MAIFEQQHLFQKLWHQNLGLIESGLGTTDLEIDTAAHGKTLTLVVRSDTNPSLTNLLSDLNHRFPEHYIYPITDLHFTILNLLPYSNNDLDSFRQEGTEIATILKAKSHLFPKAVCYHLLGLNLFQTVVYIQLIDQNAEIATFRSVVSDSLHPLLKKRVPIRPPEYPSYTSLAFINVLRFKECPSTKIVDYVAANRHTSYGITTLKEMEIVITDKLLSATNTDIVDRITLP